MRLIALAVVLALSLALALFAAGAQKEAPSLADFLDAYRRR
jgi:uncharacterized membrane protein YqhA